MRHADIEEEIVERGVHQRKSKDKTPIDPSAGLKRASTATSNREYNQSCYSKANASKEHLAARHVSCDAKATKTNFDERESPTPRDGCRQGKYNDP